MSLKKAAMLVLVLTLVSGFLLSPVSACASVSDTSSKGSVTESKDKKIKKYNKADLRLMASIINCEAGGESYQG